eukprot:jgi/Tetstr1/455103/TSEL_041955.t1
MGGRRLTKKRGYIFSVDLQDDGFYAWGFVPFDRDYLTVNIRGDSYMLCGLRMGWSPSPYYFVTFTMTFVRHYLRSPATPTPADGNVLRSRRWLRRGQWRGRARIPPYNVDDFLLFASSELVTFELRQRVADMLDDVGLHRNPQKGLWKTVLYGKHMGVDIDTATGYIGAPEA